MSGISANPGGAEVKGLSHHLKEHMKKSSSDQRQPKATLKLNIADSGKVKLETVIYTEHTRMEIEKKIFAKELSDLIQLKLKNAVEYGEYCEGILKNGQDKTANINFDVSMKVFDEIANFSKILAGPKLHTCRIEGYRLFIYVLNKIIRLYNEQASSQSVPYAEEQFKKNSQLFYALAFKDGLSRQQCEVLKQIPSIENWLTGEHFEVIDGILNDKSNISRFHEEGKITEFSKKLIESDLKQIRI